MGAAALGIAALGAAALGAAGLGAAFCVVSFCAGASSSLLSPPPVELDATLGAAALGIAAFGAAALGAAALGAAALGAAFCVVSFCAGSSSSLLSSPPVDLDAALGAAALGAAALGAAALGAAFCVVSFCASASSSLLSSPPVELDAALGAAFCVVFFCPGPSSSLLSPPPIELDAALGAAALGAAASGAAFCVAFFCAGTSSSLLSPPTCCKATRFGAAFDAAFFNGAASRLVLLTSCVAALSVVFFFRAGVSSSLLSSTAVPSGIGAGESGLTLLVSATGRFFDEETENWAANAEKERLAFAGVLTTFRGSKTTSEGSVPVLAAASAAALRSRGGGAGNATNRSVGRARRLKAVGDCSGAPPPPMLPPSTLYAGPLSTSSQPRRTLESLLGPLNSSSTLLRLPSSYTHSTRRFSLPASAIPLAGPTTRPNRLPWRNHRNATGTTREGGGFEGGGVASSLLGSTGGILADIAKQDLEGCVRACGPTWPQRNNY